MSTSAAWWSPSAAVRPRRRDQQGASAVEFALVVPILLLLVFGVINFGVVMAQKASLSNAVRIGARYGSVNAYTTAHTCKAVVAKVRDSATTVGLGTSNKRKVVVTVARVTSAGTSTTVCTGPTGADATVTAAPCVNTTASLTDPDSLKVSVSYPSGLLVPTPGLGRSVTLTASSTFQCEYSS